MDEITELQKKVLTFIVECKDQHDFTPTLKEIAEAFDWASPNAASGHVKALISKGFILKRRRHDMTVTEYARRYLAQ